MNFKNGQAGIHVRTGVAGARPNVRPYFKRIARRIAPRSGSHGPWSVPDLCAAYSWPAGLAGGGVIAIIELRGGWVRPDMEMFFQGIHQPVPEIVDISVDGTTNTPDPAPDSADVEVALDIETAAAAYYGATGRPATIKVYWTQDIASGIRRAATDGCDVCSISWGADEAVWPPEAAMDLEQAALEATQAGMVIFAASGDNDSSDGGPGPANVDFPASAPHIIGCGGTTKRSSSETVWNNDPESATGEGTGGGFSTLFPMPDWQSRAPHGPGRMVPDVAANADPNTGYIIVVHAQQQVVGGTSAVAPLYAGLFASFGQKLGFVSPQLWSHQTCFQDITTGDNGAYRAGSGPDPCTGLGSPNGKRIASLMMSSAASVAQRVKELTRENAQLRARVVDLLVVGQAS